MLWLLLLLVGGEGDKGFLCVCLWGAICCIFVWCVQHLWVCVCLKLGEVVVWQSAFDRGRRNGRQISRRGNWALLTLSFAVPGAAITAYVFVTVCMRHLCVSWHFALGTAHNLSTVYGSCVQLHFSREACDVKYRCVSVNTHVYADVFNSVVSQTRTTMNVWWWRVTYGATHTPHTPPVSEIFLFIQIIMTQIPHHRL